LSAKAYEYRGKYRDGVEDARDARRDARDARDDARDVRREKHEEQNACKSDESTLGDMTMPFGRNKGKLFKDIPITDLDSTVGWIEDTFGRPPTKFEDLYGNLVEYLKQNDAELKQAMGEE